MQKLEPAVRTLRLLQVIAEGDGLVQAAGKIGLSQSAASLAIAALERSLGVQLFARNSGQLRLSRIGEQILPRVRQILGSLDAIAEGIVSESGVQTGALRIAVVPSVASSIIPPWVSTPGYRTFPHNYFRNGTRELSRGSRR